MAKGLDIRLARERSAAARHRLLVGAGLGAGMSLGQYRRRGYKLSALDVTKAMAFLRVQDPKLAQLAKEARRFAAEMHREVRGIKTGINGLEM
jgi:hypothetical protein